MKRILQVISSLSQGGTEAVVLNYLNNISDANISFDFLVIWGNSKKFYDDYLISKGCKIFRMKHPPTDFFAHGKELSEFFKNNNYDAVHIHAMSSLRYRVAKAAKKSGVKKVIYHSHNSSSEKHLLLHKLLKPKLNKWCDYKFACSKAAGKYMYNGDFTVIKNAIDLNRFAFNETSRQELCDKYNLKGKFVIGNVGRLTEVKNQKFLLNVFNEFCKSNANAVLLIVGDGPEKNNLRNLAERFGISKKVIFTGNVGNEVYKYYSLFDVLAFPSLFEGLSMVLIEAQANGLPVFASDTLSKEHKISENFIFLPISETSENYKAWANALTSVKNGDIKRQNNSDALTYAGYDIKTEAEKLQSFYLSL